MSELIYVGLDVHSSKVSIAYCASDSPKATFVTHVGNSGTAVEKALLGIGKAQNLRVVYEAGPTGFVLCRQLLEKGIQCQVIAPSLIPKKPGDRVKTDSRDAQNLAELHRMGALTAVHLPDKEVEALRDVVRMRKSTKEDQTKARHRLSKFLLRYGISRPSHMKKNWTQQHMLWLSKLEFSEEATKFTFTELLEEVNHQKGRLERIETKIDKLVEQLSPKYKEWITHLKGLKGIATTTAATLVSELGDIRRFKHPKQLMAFVGVVPSEYSSGDRVSRGKITKAGNSHIRRVLGEAAWAYRTRPRRYPALNKRLAGLPTSVSDISWRCQNRLHERFTHLIQKGKHANKTIGAISREFLGFIWEVSQLAPVA